MTQVEALKRGVNEMMAALQAVVMPSDPLVYLDHAERDRQLERYFEFLRKRDAIVGLFILHDMPEFAMLAGGRSAFLNRVQAFDFTTFRKE